ncbi:MAG: LTA synthase family protein [Defluviitaleaceae bacterium]|nr:LTA synthase family protein [Defluviitaleaceae bacterium]
MRKIFIGKKQKPPREFAQPPWLKWALRAYAVVFPLLLFFVLEWLNPLPNYMSTGALTASVVFIALLAVVVSSATGSVFWGLVPVSLLLVIVYVVNHFKVALTGQVFVPTDLSVAGEALQVTGFNALTIERTLILWGFVIALIHVPLWFVRFKLPLKRRMITLGVSAFVFFAAFILPPSSRTAMGWLGFNQDFRGSSTMLYMETRLIMGFHQATMAQIAHNRAMPGLVEYAKDFFVQAPQVMPSDLKPNVIVIMSESFMDPHVFDQLSLSTNPVSNLHRLQTAGISGQTVVPVFGGGTANTEMEFLTGAPVYFMGGSYHIPFGNPVRYFNRNLYTAMPWLFRQQGYRTVALHPNYADFYNRDRIYPRLGFEYFIAKEDMPNAPHKGWYISDEYFTDRMIMEIQRADADNVPLFLFGISIQNHWEFWGSKYYGFPQDVYATHPHLAEDYIVQINSFLQGVYDADKQLGRLIDFIEASNRPTMVVFFGDHMPMIGAPYQGILEQIGFISTRHVWGWDGQDRERLFTTPYLIWDNFGGNRDDWGTVSAYFLAANVVAHSGAVQNTYWQNLLYAQQYFRGLTENHYIDKMGNFMYIDSVWDKLHVRALAGLVHAKWFGDCNFHQSLSVISVSD